LCQNKASQSKNIYVVNSQAHDSIQDIQNWICKQNQTIGFNKEEQKSIKEAMQRIASDTMLTSFYSESNSRTARKQGRRPTPFGETGSNKAR
jgi:hypothetical protein